MESNDARLSRRENLHCGLSSFSVRFKTDRGLWPRFETVNAKGEDVERPFSVKIRAETL